MVLDKQNMQAPLAVFRYVIECIRLDVGHVVRLLFKFTSKRMRNIDMLLKDSWGALRRLCVYDYIMRSIILYLNGTRCKVKYLSDEYLWPVATHWASPGGVVCWNKRYWLIPLCNVSGMKTLEKTNEETNW